MIKLKKLFVIFLSAVIVSLPTLSMADETPVQNLVAGQSDIAESNEDLGGKKNDMFEFGGDSQIDSMDSAIAAMLTDVVEEPEVQAPQSSAPVAKKVTPTTVKKDTAVSPVLSKNANNMIKYSWQIRYQKPS